MPAYFPILLAGAYLVLAADRVPDLNFGPSCRAAADSAALANRDESSCKRDEQAARDKLQQQWGDYSTTQRTHCVRLSTLGGSPSYVELLTCLEMAKDAQSLPVDPLSSERVGR